MKIREGWVRYLDQLFKIYLRPKLQTSEIHLMAIHCAAGC